MIKTVSSERFEERLERLQIKFNPIFLRTNEHLDLVLEGP